MNYENILWILFWLIIGVSLSIDLGLFQKLKNLKNLKNNSKKVQEDQTRDLTRNQELKRSLQWTFIWISLAMIFAVLIYFHMGYEKMFEFVTAYTLEKSLSVDNLFVFLLIFSTLSIPYSYQHKILSVGILSAIVFRILFVLIGISLLENFHWMIYVFGILLIATAIKLLSQRKEKKIELEKSISIRILKKFIPINLNIKSDKFFIKQNGILYATSLLVALVMIEMTDLLFAIDSIPAVLAISSDYFIVITSNIFAILGLRSLYLLLAGVMDKFYYLKYALIVLLLFIGTKMMISEFYKISIEISLIIILFILAPAIIFSILKYNKHETDYSIINKNEKVK